jgi:hypothetical protein
MPVVVTCPACQKRARVPEPMVGKTVRCPACEATFVAGSEGPAAAPAPPEAPVEGVGEDESSPVVVARPPLPADADVLRCVRAGVHLQFLAQTIYAAALAVFLLLALGSVVAGSPPGGAMGSGPGIAHLSTWAALATLLLVGASAILGVTGGALCTLAPNAYLARGLAIAGLILGSVGLMESMGLFRMFGFLLLMDSPVRGINSMGPPGAAVLNFFLPLILAGLFEAGRQTVLALFWRAICFLLRDGSGALLALRLAYAVPTVQGILLLLGLLFASIGGVGSGAMEYVTVVGGLAQLALLVWGLIVVERVWRRLRSVVPPA